MNGDASPQQIALRFLRNEILSGRLAAGTWLKTEAIAKYLEMSRMPVRDALRQLEAEGLVTIRMNRGALVTNLTVETVMELFEIRSALEGLAAAIAAEQYAAGDVEDFEHLIDQLERSKNNHARWLEYHDTVHDRLCELSNRRELCDQIRKLRARVRPYLLLFSSTHGNPEIPGHEHRLFLDPLRRRDAAAIRKVVEAHVLENGRSIVEDIRLRQAAGAAAATTRPAKRAAKKPSRNAAPGAAL